MSRASLKRRARFLHARNRKEGSELSKTHLYPLKENLTVLSIARHLHSSGTQEKSSTSCAAIVSMAIVSVSIKAKKSLARKCSLLLFAADSIGMFS